MGLLEIAIKMIFCLLVAGILGWIVGFFLGRIYGSANATELLNECEGRMRVRNQEVSGMRGDLALANSKIGSLQTELATLATTLKTRDGWVTEMEVKNRELQADLDARLSELDELKAEQVQAQSAFNAQLDKVFADTKAQTAALRARVAEAEAAATSAQGTAAELASVRAVSAAQEEELAQALLRLKNLEARAEQGPEHEAQRRDWEAKYVALSRAKEQEIARLKVRITELELMAREVKEPAVKVSPASALPPRPKERDDLKKVYGIGPVLEQVLNEQGIYWFRQIAAWTPEDVEQYDELLEEFHGRIERENWIASAREEHYKKYNEQL